MNDDDEQAKKKEFGPGSIFAFSLWNHASGPYPPEYVPPQWGEVDGYPTAYDSVCDEWVRLCIEEPNDRFSQDMLPCAWTMDQFLEASINSQTKK